MSSAQALGQDDASMRRAVLRLLVVVSVLMLLAGVPMLAAAGNRSTRAERELRHVAASLRGALSAFHAQHDGRWPDGATWTSVLDQLSRATDIDGHVGGAFGPYLSPAWVGDDVAGPGTGLAVDNLPGGPDGSSRWIWCRRTGELRCNSAGRAPSGTPWWEF